MYKRQPVCCGWLLGSSFSRPLLLFYTSTACKQIATVCKQIAWFFAPNGHRGTLTYFGFCLIRPNAWLVPTTFIVQGLLFSRPWVCRGWLLESSIAPKSFQNDSFSLFFFLSMLICFPLFDLGSFLLFHPFVACRSSCRSLVSILLLAPFASFVYKPLKNYRNMKQLMHNNSQNWSRTVLNYHQYMWRNGAECLPKWHQIRSKIAPPSLQHPSKKR